MAIDDRKERIMMAIVSLYSDGGEPVGSNLLSRYFDMAVSSATLRNEMAALTRLGLLEQPHTSAGRVPTAKGYRYYVDNLLTEHEKLARTDREEIDALFEKLDYDPEKMAQGAAVALADMMQAASVATTPRAQDVSIAHFDLIQVGRHTVALLAVTAAGGVRTRVVKVEYEIGEGDIKRVRDGLNTHLRFVAEADVNAGRIRTLMDSFGSGGARYWSLVSAALTLLGEAGKPNIYFEGQKYLLHWPELADSLRPMMELFSDQQRAEEILSPTAEHIAVLFGDEFPEKPIPGLCIISGKYVAGGGLSGLIAVVGPSRIDYRKVIPRLEYFSNKLGQAMSGAATNG